MRPYRPKDNVQKKAYYNDRFYVTPQIPKDDPASDEVYSKDIEKLQSKFSISESYIQRGELVIYIDPDSNVEVLEFLKDELDYSFLMEMSAVDFLAQREGFEIFYELLSLSKRKRIRVKTFIKENQAIESVQHLFRSANFAEREMFDMFGIQVNNHPYLKRILMPDDWEGYPLRKTYPLQGDEFAQWYEVDKIFGKEARDIVGPEIRDSAHIDRYDTERFARLGHEVPRGTDISKDEPDTDNHEFQEEGGVFLIKDLNKPQKVLSEKERRER
ncbi:MAG TPA: NADH-quinone oxidoreductase subunit C [Campylobacterales bacterium]|nr:NADH-quinone oxidoreductase subunit C [Campylobacterales bacterium]HIO70328.1 NADH-quinone oxidoreductase subunit C [Campylobacterales bacterium]